MTLLERRSDFRIRTTIVIVAVAIYLGAETVLLPTRGRQMVRRVWFRLLALCFKRDGLAKLRALGLLLASIRPR